MKFQILVVLLALFGISNAFVKHRIFRHADDKWHLQIEELKKGVTSPEELKEKVSKFYEELTDDKEKFLNFYKNKCVSWIKKVASEEEQVELKSLNEAKDYTTLSAKLKELGERLPIEKKEKVQLWSKTCLFLWDVEDLPLKRVRRSNFGYDLLETEWLTDSQKEELTLLTPDTQNFNKKYLEAFNGLSPEYRKIIADKIVKKCYGWLKEAATQEERDELEQLHHKDHSQCKQKIREYLAKLDGGEQDKIRKHLSICESVWYSSHHANHEHDHHANHEHDHHANHEHDHHGHHNHRRRRHEGHKEHHGQHNLEDYLKTHLSWLSVEQADELKKLKANGKTSDEIQTKVFEFYDAAEGETKTKATELLQGGCRELIQEIVGEEKANELKTLKESGASKEDLHKKVKELLDAVTDEHKKEIANKYESACKKVFGVASRKRRDFDDVPSIERFVEIHSTWLTKEQKNEIADLGNANEEILEQKIDEFYQTTSGETREKATKALQGICCQLISKAIGKEKAGKIKAMEEAGNEFRTIQLQIEKFINEITDDTLREHILQKKAYCFKIYNLGRHRRDHDDNDENEHDEHGHFQRRRRHEDDSSTEGFVKNHLFWLTDEQKEEFLKLKDSRDAMHKKLDEFYNAATGETKVKATESMLGACRELVFKAIGEEKANEIKAMKKSGKSFTEIELKIEEYLKEVTDEKLKGYIKEHSDRCRQYFKQSTRMRRDRSDEEAENLDTTVVGEEKIAENLENPKTIDNDVDVNNYNSKNRRHTNHEGGNHDHDKHQHRMRRNGDVEDEENNTDKAFYEPNARIVDYRQKRDHHDGHGQHTLEDYLKTHLSWLSVEQADELKKLKANGKTSDEIQTKVFEFYDAAEGETKTKATELLQGGCRELIQEIVGEEKANELKHLKESGASKEDLRKKVKELLDAVTDEHKKEIANKYESACKKVFGVASRRRRHEGKIDKEDFIENHLTWLTEEQKAEIQKLKDDSDAVEKKVHEFYEATTGETRVKATEELQASCRELMHWILGDKFNEITKLKESGAAKVEIAKKVDELYSQVTDEEKKRKGEKYKTSCKKLFGVESRKRRHEGHHGQHNLEDYLKTHLSWLTVEQADELKKLKANGKTSDEIQTKVFEFYDAAEGETKTKATELLQGGCRELIQEIVGEEKANELKNLKESGASKEDLRKKVKELLDAVTDEHKKEIANKYESACKKVFGVASRKRRDFDDVPSIERFVEIHSTWLTKEQKNEIADLGNANEEILEQKIDEFYQTTSGETREKATKALQGICCQLISKAIGKEKAGKIKAMEEAGNEFRTIQLQIEKFINEITDDTLREHILQKKAYCFKIYNLGRHRRNHDDNDENEHDEHGHFQRRRRHEDDSSTEGFVKNHLFWLTDEQKEEFLKLKDSRDAMHKKLDEFYNAATGETKVKATESMLGACRELVFKAIGEEKANEIKAMKKSGKSFNEIELKIEEYLKEVTDEKLKGYIKEHSDRCRQYFKQSTRMRRHRFDEEAENLDTTVVGKEKIAENLENPKTIDNDVDVNNYNSKNRRHTNHEGENHDHDKHQHRMRRNGNVEDEENNTDKAFYEPDARIVDYRQKRDHHDGHGQHTLEDYLKTHLSWLSVEQADELKKLKANGKTSDEIQTKVFEFYDAAEGETKTKATELLQGGCRELIQEIVGEEKANELKHLKESGASKEDLRKKVKELLDAVTDEHKKEIANKYESACKKVFGVASRRRRHEGKIDKEDFIENHLTWLTEEQKAEIQKLKDDSDAVEKKVHEFYEATTGETRVKATEELQASCRELMHWILGDKFNEITKLKESGAAKVEIAKKVDELYSQVTDEEKKRKGEKYKTSCKKLFGVESRKRRHEGHHGQHNLEDYLKTHLSWLTVEQADELKKLKANGKTSDEIQTKVFEFYDAAEGETKTKATELLQGGCRELIQEIVGEEKANELKNLKESGASKEDLRKKVKELLDAVTDEHKKEIANKYESACKKVFGVASRKRRDFDDVPSIERFVEIHSTWLTKEQKNEIADLGNANEEILEQKIDEFYQTTSGETREKATKALQGICCQLISKAIGKEKAGKIKAMEEAGNEFRTIQLQIEKFINEITDDTLREHILQKKAYCFKIYNLGRHRRNHDDNDENEHDEHGHFQRRRRHEDDSSTEGFVKNHLFWLTDEQKEEFLKLKDSRDAMHKKLDEFYNAATGETKVKATESMLGACRELVFKAIGEEKANEIKAMKKSGKSFNEIELKIEEYLKEVTDEKLKGYIKEHSDRCRQYFKQSTRMRRHRFDEEAENLDTTVVGKEKIAENLENPKTIDNDVDVNNYNSKNRRHTNHEGENHDHDKHQHRMRRNGNVEDEENNTDKAFYEPDARIVDYRQKRDHHDGHGQHTLEDYLKTHLSWLSVEQADELKKLKANGKTSDEIQTKVFEFYDAAEGETKTKATELLQGGCRELIQEIVGEEKANELKNLKESGASKEDLHKKVKELLDAITDKDKKELANKFEGPCRRVFGVASRKRRDHHQGHGQHTLEDYFKTHLSWLTVEQADELKKLKADGKTAAELQAKVFEFYDVAEGETKTKATELLQGGCRELVTSVIGEEKAKEIKALKESGASNDEIAKKVFELVDQADSSSKKDLVKKYEAACKKVHGVSSRRRREEGENKFESYLMKYLSWLTDDQKQTLRQLRSEGKTREEMQDKLFEFYDNTDGDLKQTATESLKNACRDLLARVLEPAHSEELKQLEETGKSVEELSDKVKEFLKDVTDESKKELIQKYSTGCKRVFGLTQNRKRRAFKPKLTHLDFMKAVVLNENLPTPNHRELSYKIMDIYDAQTLSETARDVVNQCHHLFAETVSLGFYMNDYSARELLNSLRSASNRQLSTVVVITEVCSQAIKELEATEGRHGSVGDTLVKLFSELDAEVKNRLGAQWRSKCSDWIIEVTDQEERSFLKMLFRTKQFEPLRERINEFISRFDDTTRTEVGHMRSVCEHLLGLTHHGRKTFQRTVPIETVF